MLPCKFSPNIFSLLSWQIGEVKALKLPMACKLGQFKPSSSSSNSNAAKKPFHFSVRAVDASGRAGPFTSPQKIEL